MPPVTPLPSPLDPPPPAAILEAEFGARSRRGPLRSVNEDHYLVLRLGRYQETLMTSLPPDRVAGRLDEYGYGMVIADGMGGAGAGEAASRIAISTLVQLAFYFGKGHVRVDEPIADEMMDRVERFYRSIDSTLLMASRNAEHSLQTTMTVVYAAGNELFFAHLGHSRAYMLRDNELAQLTRDQTLDRERRGSGVIMSVGSSARDLHHIVTSPLGAPRAGTPMIDVERVELLDGDRILLCTNGLTDVADDAGIATVLRLNRTPDEQCGALLDLAAASGGNDDVTALVAHYRIRARAEAMDVMSVPWV